jgi:hypothetical protein
MWNNWIGRRIRSGGRTLLLWGLILCGGAIGLGWMARGVFADALSKPVRVEAESLVSTEVVDQVRQGFILVDSSEVRDTGATLGFAKRPDRVLARYLAVRAGNHWLLVKVPGGHEGSTFAGMLGPVNSGEVEKVIVPFAHNDDIDPALFLPFCVDCTQDTRRALVVSLFFLAVFLVPGLVLTVLGLRRLLRPETQSLARALQRFGPPAEVADAIDHSGQPLRLGPVEFAGDWLVCNSPASGCVVFRTEDLVWIHKLVVTLNRTPLHRLKLYDRLGVRFEGSGKQDTIDLALAAITERTPWLIVGWDERVEMQWKDDPASLVPRVEERREEMRAKGVQRPEA